MSREEVIPDGPITMLSVSATTVALMFVASSHVFSRGGRHPAAVAGTWLSQLSSTVLKGCGNLWRGAKHPDWEGSWETWSREAIDSPGKWKSRIRRAQAAALRKERWEASNETHAGLLNPAYRSCVSQVCQLGAGSSNVFRAAEKVSFSVPHEKAACWLEASLRVLLST